MSALTYRLRVRARSHRQRRHDRTDPYLASAPATGQPVVQRWGGWTLPLVAVPVTRTRMESHR
jgi:hypothetical protein